MCLSLRIACGEYLFQRACAVGLRSGDRACYVAIVLYVGGMVLIGAAFQEHLTVAAFIIGWGLVEIATMVNTVAICKLGCLMKCWRLTLV